MGIKKFQAGLAVTAFIFSASTAEAVDVPTSAEPGVVIRNFEEERREPSKLENIIEVEDKAKPSSSGKEKVFKLEKVTIEGSTVYSQGDIDEITAPYIGQQVSIDDLNAIAKDVTKKYREDGYIFSSAVLSPQKIKDGIVHLKAVEGRITEVNLAGEYKDDNDLIKHMADKIKNEDGPANTKDIERYLLLIDDLPGIKARGIVRPSKTPGGGELIINIEQDKFEGAAGLDNRGSEFLGQYRFTGVAAANSLFGIHDRTTLRGIISSETDELRFADLAHEEQIGSEGLRLKGRVAVTKTQPGDDLAAFDIDGNSQLYDIETLFPLVRSRQFNVNLLGGFTAVNSDSDVLGLDIANDKVRYFRAGTTFDFTDELAGVTQVGLMASQGVDVFGATEDGANRSRVNGEHNFFRANFFASRIQDIAYGFSAELGASGQYSPDALLASEEFALGGPAFGRGYDAGEITGDKGLAGILELRYSDSGVDDFLHSYQLYTYYDVGTVWNKDPVVGEMEKLSLASAGLGVRFNLEHDLSGYVEFSKPLTKDVLAEGNNGSRLFFNVLKRF